MNRIPPIQVDIGCKCLFVGGPADGEWINPGKMPVVRIPERFTGDIPGHPSRVIRITDYEPMRFVSGDEEFRVWHPMGWSSELVFRQMLRGYKSTQ